MVRLSSALTSGLTWIYEFDFKSVVHFAHSPKLTIYLALLVKGAEVEGAVAAPGLSRLVVLRKLK